MIDRTEVGVIPYLQDADGFRVCIITTRRNRTKWILPKGQRDTNLTDHEAAIVEAFEEAGLVGDVSRECIEVKAESGGEKVLYRFFPMKVVFISKVWPEKKIRRRRFAGSDELPGYLDKKPWLKAVRRLEAILAAESHV